MNLANIISLIALIVAIAVPILSREHGDNIRFTDAFNKIYTLTFSLRAKVSGITRKYYQKDFYYELDSICSNVFVEEAILDYLTEMENFFNLISGHFITQQTLNKLVSLAFYQRVAMLYPYVLCKMEMTGNQDMFSNYRKVVKKMKRIGKVAAQIQNVTHVCYVGVRESDIIFSNDYFEKSICLFSTDPQKEPFPVRINQNINTKDSLPYVTSRLTKMHKEYPGMHFMFYNQSLAYNYPDEILQNSICLNDRELLSLLNNKLMLKKWLLDHNIPVVPYETFNGEEITFSSLTTHFGNADRFVIQCLHGGGGIGTYFADRVNFSNVLHKIHPLQKYVVSPYLDSVSVNTHVFIAEKQTVLSPGSIQIINKSNDQLCYYGCDFIAYRSLDSNIREQIKQLSLHIADYLRNEGYKGVAGIDFIVGGDQQIYCTEINPRFQSSTLLLDCHLKGRERTLDVLEAKSCYKINEMAFAGNMVTTLHYEDEINYSCYYYYKGEHDPQYFKEKYDLLKSENIEVFSDGMEYYLSNRKTDDNSYLFRAVFPHAICKVSPDMKLWVNDNIPVSSMPVDRLALKIALLNQGIRFGKMPQQIRKGVYESIDITVKADHRWGEDTVMNCAYQIHLSRYSPFQITYKEHKYSLYYYHEKIANVEPEKELLEALSDTDRKILYVATDRLRIKLVTGCEQKNMGKGCKFCNLPFSTAYFSTDEIKTALEHIEKENIPFRHILIGGGSCLQPDAWDKIISICRILKSNPHFCDKPISLMSVLPPIERLFDLKKAGIEEVAFNIEVANADLAQKLMPGKHMNGKTYYYKILREAVKVFGVGNVRSALLVGLDTTKDLYNEISTLADMDVLPCLSAFRALPGSDFEGELNPSNEYLMEVYQHAESLLNSRQGSINTLGPRCRLCRNNMLIL